MNDRRRILLADDDPDIREVGKILLESEGFEVVEASDGIEAVDKAAPDVDLYILDVMMPGKSGYQACREIRAKSQAPILFLTARTQDQDKTMGFSAGANLTVAGAADPDARCTRCAATGRISAR